MRAIDAKLGIQHLYCVIAEALIAAGRAGDARAELAVASAHIAETGEGLYAADIRRLEGEAALATNNGPNGRAAARRCFEAALKIAHAQGAGALELRVATSLRQLTKDCGARRGHHAREPHARADELLQG